MKEKIHRSKYYLAFMMMDLLLIVMGIFLYAEELPQSEEHEYLTSYSAAKFNNISLKDGEIVQEFRAEQDNLHIFYVWLKNCSSADSGFVKIKILDKAGKQYYEGQYALNELGDDGFCWVGGMQGSLRKGNKYELVLYTEDAVTNAEIQAVTDTDLLDSMGKLTVNGTEKEDAALYLLQQYDPTTYSMGIVWIFLWIMAGGLGAVFIFTASETVRKSVAALIMIWELAAAFLAVELPQASVRTMGQKYILINCAVIIGIFLILYSVAKSYAGYVTLFLCGALGATNYFVKQFRGTALQIMDIKSIPTAISVAGNYSFDLPLMLYTVLIILIISIGLLTLRQKQIREETKTDNKRDYGLRGGAAACGIAIFILINNVFVPGEDFSWFNMNTYFVKFGWLYTNMIVQRGSKLRKPEGYSDENIRNIVADITQEENAQEVVPENIIVIMNESLGDLGELGTVVTNQDYMPFIHNLEENTVKGDLFVSTFGGGTAITEYEFLTGNTEHFFPPGRVPYSSLCEEREEGLPRILQRQGFHTVAMHPYEPRNWNRDKVYNAMGFNEFISIEEYADAELVRHFVSDQADYDKIIEYVENYEEDSPLFIFNVTMQNHGGYDINNGKMDTTVEIGNFESSVAETYLSLIYESDKAFENMIEYFSGYGEPTMIVMFGDHMPSLPNHVYDSIYGKTDSELNAEERNKKYTTPYVIWTNYENDFQEKEVISANYLGSYVLQCAGLQMTDYNRFLLNFMEEIPAVGQYGFLNWEGQFVSYEESDGQVFWEYELMQYMRVKDRKSQYYTCFSIQDN